MPIKVRQSPLNTYPLIILAAGRSSRFGFPKGLARLPDGRVWIQSQLEMAKNIGFQKCILMLGPDQELYQAPLEMFHQQIQHDINSATAKVDAVPASFSLTVLNNPLPETGAWASLLIALKSLLASEAQDTFPGVFLLPIDVPISDTSVWHNLQARLSSQVLAAVPMFKERSGHPVLLSHALSLSILSSAHSFERLDHFLKGQIPGTIAKVAVSDAQVCLNINTQQDWFDYLHSNMNVSKNNP